MIQNFNETFKSFFKSKSINFYKPINSMEFQCLQMHCMHHLEDVSFHSHNDKICKSPNLDYVSSYHRNYIIFDTNTLIEDVVTIPVFYCHGCQTYHALLPNVCIVPYCQYSLFFILQVLFDKYNTKLTVDNIVNKYHISKSTLYRWIDKYSSILSYYKQLRHKYSCHILIVLFYCHFDLIHDFFDITGYSLFQMKRRLYKPPIPQ